MKTIMRINQSYRMSFSDILILWSAVVLFLFAGTASLITAIIPIGMIQCILSGSGLACILILYLMRMPKYTPRKLLYLFLMIVMVFFAVFRSNWGFVSLSTFLISAVFFLFSMEDSRFIYISDMLLKWLFIMNVIYAVFTVACFFSSSFFYSVVLPLFPQNRDRMIELYNQNCIVGLTTHYSTNGTFLSIGALFAFSKYLVEKNKKNGLFTIGFIITILMTGKRAHIIFVALSIFIVYFLSQTDKRMIIRILKMMGVVFVLGIVALIVIIKVPSLATFVTRFTDNSSDDVSSGRFELWSLAFDAFKKNPIFGIGWRHYMSDVGPLFSANHDYDTHNVYIQLLCETGLIGAVCYYIWILIFYVKTIKLYKKSVKQMAFTGLDSRKFYLGFSLLYQSFFLMYCFTGNPLYEIYTFVPYFISCGLTMYFSRKERIVTFS